MVAQELYGEVGSNVLSGAVLFGSEAFNKKSVEFKDAAYVLFVKLVFSQQLRCVKRY